MNAEIMVWTHSSKPFVIDISPYWTLGKFMMVVTFKSFHLTKCFHFWDSLCAGMEVWMYFHEWQPTKVRLILTTLKNPSYNIMLKYYYRVYKDGSSLIFNIVVDSWLYWISSMSKDDQKVKWGYFFLAVFSKFFDIKNSKLWKK